MTPLHLACNLGTSVEIVATLLHAGAFVNVNLKVADIFPPRAVAHKPRHCCCTASSHNNDKKPRCYAKTADTDISRLSATAAWFVRVASAPCCLISRSPQESDRLASPARVRGGQRSRRGASSFSHIQRCFSSTVRLLCVCAAAEDSG